MLRHETNDVYNARGQVVGHFQTEESGLWLVKGTLDPVKHQLQRPPAWATDAAHIDELRRRGGVGVRLLLCTGDVLEADLATFDRHALVLERGHGLQYALVLKHWGRRLPGTRQLMLLGMEGAV